MACGQVVRYSCIMFCDVLLQMCNDSAWQLQGRSPGCPGHGPFLSSPAYSYPLRQQNLMVPAVHHLHVWEEGCTDAPRNKSTCRVLLRAIAAVFRCKHRQHRAGGLAARLRKVFVSVFVSALTHFCCVRFHALRSASSPGRRLRAYVCSVSSPSRRLRANVCTRAR